jgi:hypothetical protein
MEIDATAGMFGRPSSRTEQSGALPGRFKAAHISAQPIGAEVDTAYGGGNIPMKPRFRRPFAICVVAAFCVMLASAAAQGARASLDHKKAPAAAAAPAAAIAGPELRRPVEKAELDVKTVKVIKVGETSNAIRMSVTATIVNRGGTTEHSLSAAGRAANCQGRSKARVEWTNESNVPHLVCVQDIPALSRGGSSTFTCVSNLNCSQGLPIIRRGGKTEYPCSTVWTGKPVEKLVFKVVPDSTQWLDEKREGGDLIGWAVWPDWY